VLPVPTRRAFYAFVGAAVGMLVGVGLGSWPATVLGGAVATGLAFALAVTMPLGRRVRRHRLEFAWWLGHGDPGSGAGAVVPGKPFPVRCFLRHRGPMGVGLRGLTPIAPPGVGVEDPRPAALHLAPNTRTEFTFRLSAPAAGRAVLHGLAVTLPGPFGLFEVPLYFPNPLVIKVLPQAAARSRGAPRTLTGLPIERSGASLLSPVGGGTELREIRELRPGDPFKSIAWKASARAGKLLVREVDQEVQETRVVIVDVSGTMRGGDPGHRKIDWAVEAAAAEGRRALDRGDRIGLITVDGRILGHVAPSDGRPQLLRLFEELLRALEVVDEDLTEVDDSEVAALVGRYVRQQDGVDFSLERGTQWNVPLMLRHVERGLAEAEDDAPIRAASKAGEQLRRFCRVRGIPLPYRAEPLDGAKGPALAAALKLAGGRSRTPMTLTVISDLDGLGDLDDLVSTFELLRLHHHTVTLVVPDGPTFARRPRSRLEEDLYAVYGRAEDRRFAEARKRLWPLGVRVLRATAADPPALVTLTALKRRRRAA
jgi:uncharacterized protein (DUF58 family)